MRTPPDSCVVSGCFGLFLFGLVICAAALALILIARLP